MSDRRILSLTRASSNRTDYHFTGVDADTALNRYAASGQHFSRISFEFFLQAQRRIERALRMVLVRHRRAEQGEDAVAGRLHDVAVVAMGRVDH